MHVGRAFPVYADVVASSIVFERNMERLMNIAYPMAQKFQRRQLVRITGRTRRKHGHILLNRGPRASVCYRTLIAQRDASGRSGEIDEVLGGSLARMIRPDARVAEEVEFGIRLNEAANFRPRFRCRQPKCKLAHNAMAGIAP